MVQHFTASTYVKKTFVVLAMMAGVSTVALAQSAEDKQADDYAALLQQIADLETTIAHKQVYIGTQEAEMASLQKQIVEAQAVIDSVEPMLEKMRVAITAEIDSDIPFNVEERNNRLGRFQDLMETEGARPIDKMRSGLGLYEAEVSYGQSVSAYSGDHPNPDKVGDRLEACEADAASPECALTKSQREKVLEDKTHTIADLASELKDGHYLRYGRLALAYMQADGSEILRYDVTPDGANWVEMTGNRALDVRRAVKMAKGEAAPNVIKVPLYVTE